MDRGGPPAAIVARFRSLAVERIERIDAGWAALTQGAAGDERAREVRRELHTLKGDARVLGFGEIAELCHKLEDLFAAAHARDYAVPDELDLVVTMAMRFLTLLVRKKAAATLGGLDLPGVIRQIDDSLIALRNRSMPPPSVGPNAAARGIEAPDRVSMATQRRLALAATGVFLESVTADGGGASRLRAIFSELGAVVEALSAVSLTAVLARHAHGASELAATLGKQIDVIFEPADIVVRADVAEALDVAVLHILRNAVDHGIEPPDERVAVGKPASGTVRIHAYAEGEAAFVLIGDDGRGIDWDMVRARGVAMGLFSTEIAASVIEAELVEILFQPGFSTRGRASSVSGRGIGLDAVRAALRRAGFAGGINVATRAHRGTTFTLRVPYASRTIDVQCFESSFADLLVAVPASVAVTLEVEGERPVRDPLELLGLPSPARARTSGGRWIARFRDDIGISIRAGSIGRFVTAYRLCPTGDDLPVEIVRIDGREALFLRPEQLAPPVG
jgi:two-component system, chemotaxis family, sensor kinase CheA